MRPRVNAGVSANAAGQNASAGLSSSGALNGTNNVGSRATGMANRASRTAQNSANAVQQQTTQDLNREQAGASASGSAHAGMP